MKKQKLITLKRFFLFYRYFPTIVCILGSVVCVALRLSSILTGRDDLTRASLIALVVFSACSLLYDYFFGKILYKVGYDSLTKISRENRRRLREGNTDIVSYPENVIRDFFEWNREDKGLADSRKDIRFTAAKTDYKSLNLHYLDESHTLISHYDLHTRRIELITLSGSYRNALMEVYYPFEKDDGLKEEEFDVLLNKLKDGLKEFDDIRFSPVLDEQGIYVFFPHIDSLSYLKEKVRWRQRHLSLNRRDSNGARRTLTARFAIVCYPYSGIDELFPDIHYAIRRQKPFVRYLPKRLSSGIDYESSIRSSARYRNTTGKILTLLNGLDVAEDNKQIAKNSLSSVLTRILQSFSIRYAGRILLSEEDNEYIRSLSATGKKEDKPFIAEGDKISNLFMKGVLEASEEDGSYFASKRSQRSSQIAEYADRMGFSSCFFYGIYDEQKKPQGLLFFLNKDENRELDSYLRESLLVFSSRIADDYVVYLNRKKRLERKQVNSSRRKRADYAYYKIDKKTYLLKEGSENLPRISKDAKPGLICYKALYGLDAPCKDCPLKTGTKRAVTRNGNSFETSLTLYEEDASEASLLVKKNRNNQAGYEDVYDHDLLINSFSTLVQSRTDLYKIYGKGYLIVLRFDSIGELIKAKGSEGALLVLRSFLSGRKEGINGTRLYRFTPGSIGLLVPNCGQSDAISICESIDEWVEKYHQKNPTISLRVTYLPIIFPQGYPAATDFLSHARDRVASVRGQTSVNTIYFEEGDYYRVASKKLFRLDTIKEKFTNNTFRVLLQPLLDAKNKQIFGAERLLRLDDDFRKTQLNTAQLIQVAYENNRIGLISNALLSYRGDLYRQYGNAFFKIMGIRRITLNTSSSFLKDEDLSTKRKNRITSEHVPQNFFALEIPEKDIYDDYLSRKPFAKKRTSLGVTLICDGFTGEFVSLERLQELGFSEIKIGRDIVGHIDTDRIKYTQLLSFLQDGKEYGLKVGLIGVENREQYRMIKEMGYDCYRQGYAFYPPIEKEDFVKAVRHTNISIVSLAEKE